MHIDERVQALQRLHQLLTRIVDGQLVGHYKIVQQTIRQG